ncbi:hypothetical protein [Streptomyces sp. NBC_00859]|uniref:hypothetical protein n=1 Tax=Streptomyces sp. NBC_00859 TaxID=2903682 RepID=UPI00386DE09D|nr:hypothetical protein OG584_11805 [Streptomyces sp. NBC_00859]
MHHTASGMSNQQFAAARPTCEKAVKAHPGGTPMGRSGTRISTNSRTAPPIWLGTSALGPGRHG